MKIRIKGNSIRFRLTQTDMNQLVNQGFLEEKTEFPTQIFKYSLQTSDQVSLTADFSKGSISLFIPKDQLSDLAHTELIGLEKKQGILHLLVEKDFTCLDTVSEDQSDHYPNPHAEISKF